MITVVWTTADNDRIRTRKFTDMSEALMAVITLKKYGCPRVQTIFQGCITKY